MNTYMLLADTVYDECVYLRYYAIHRSWRRKMASNKESETYQIEYSEQITRLDDWEGYNGL